MSGEWLAVPRGTGFRSCMFCTHGSEPWDVCPACLGTGVLSQETIDRLDAEAYEEDES